MTVTRMYETVQVADCPGDRALRAAIPTFKLMPDAPVPERFAHLDAVFYLPAVQS